MKPSLSSMEALQEGVWLSFMILHFLFDFRFKVVINWNHSWNTLYPSTDQFRVSLSIDHVNLFIFPVFDLTRLIVCWLAFHLDFKRITFFNLKFLLSFFIKKS